MFKGICFVAESAFWGAIYNCQSTTGKGTSIYEIRKIFGFFLPLAPLATVTNQLILSLLSAFWGPPPPAHCGRHIWKPPKLACKKSFLRRVKTDWTSSSIMTSDRASPLWVPDILALRHVSRIFGHCNNPALLVTHFQASIWALNRRMCHAHKPDRKAVMGCCNVRQFYWRALEWGCLLGP